MRLVQFVRWARRLSLLATTLSLPLASLPSFAKPTREDVTREVTAGGVTGHPFFQLVERERATSDLAHTIRRETPVPWIIPRPPGGDVAASFLDCEHANHDIELDPATGELVATMELRVRANGGPLGAIGLMLDEGLAIGDVTSPGRTIAVSEQVASPLRVFRLNLTPPIAKDTAAILKVPYRGTLFCGVRQRGGGGLVCAKGKDFSTFSRESIFPYIYDLAAEYDYVLDTMTRDIVLRVPAEVDVVATGERVSEVTIGATKVSTWSIDKPLSRVFGLYVFAGKLGLMPVAGRTTPTTLVFPAPAESVDQRLATWSAPVLDFVERAAGQKLPFEKTVSLVRLPQDLGDPGTATYGMTLLSESYAQIGNLVHEETWAHENAHLFWGIVVPELDTFESRLMSEGMATLLEIDYTRERHFPDEDRDTYLTRRFLPIGLDLRVFGKDLPPVQITSKLPTTAEFATHLYTLWAYYKSAATLDHLRVTVGDDAFARGLASYVERCSFVGCHPDMLRTVLEEQTHKDLRPFFARWVTASTRPRVRVGFAPAPDGADVELRKEDDEPMTLELWSRLEDGQLSKQLVDLGARSSTMHLTAPGPIRAISISPRHDVMVDAVSAIDGDLDFDGESDGLDVLRCVRLVGKHYTPVTPTGLWTVDEKFDPRCDVNHDERIDEKDVALLGQWFGKLRASR